MKIRIYQLAEYNHFNEVINMENLTEIIRSIFFNRKNVKKYLVGEFDPTEEELTKIEMFLDQVLEADELKEIEKNYSNTLKRQIEQKKIPYLKELSVEELDFLLTRQMGLDDILQVIFAKGGLAKGFASIQWNNETKLYEQANTDVKEGVQNSVSGKILQFHHTIQSSFKINGQLA